MAYATKQQLATYLGVTVGNLPTNIETLLERATETIDYVTLGRIDITDTTQASVAQKSTCQQTEYFMQLGTDTDIAGRDVYEQISIGSWSANFNSKVAPPRLAPRARQTLFLAGMLYRGVRMI